MTVTPLTQAARQHGSDIFHTGESFHLDEYVTVRITDRHEVTVDGFDALVEAANAAFDHFDNDDPSWRIRSHDFNDNEATVCVLHEATRITPDGESVFVAPARDLFRTMKFRGDPEDASFEVNASLEDRHFGEQEEVRVGIPSTGSDSLSAAEARSLAQTLEANATDSAFHTLVNADSAEGVLEAAQNLRRAAEIIKARERTNLIE